MTYVDRFITTPPYKSAGKNCMLKETSRYKVFNADFGGAEVCEELKAGKRFFFDGDHSISGNFFKNIKSLNVPCHFLLLFQNRTFYKINLVDILREYLKENLEGLSLSEETIDTIITVAQETFANGFMWSSLELKSTLGNRECNFYEVIEERLKDDTFGCRQMAVYISAIEGFVEFGLYVQGQPIVWTISPNRPSFRGTSIISSFTDYILFDKEKMGIRLFFVP